MQWKRIRFLGCFLWLLFFTGSASLYANDAELLLLEESFTLPSQLSLHITRDSAQTRTVNLLLDMGVVNDTRLRLGYYASTFSDDEASDMSGYLLAAQGSSLEPLSIGFQIQEWQQSNQIKNQSYIGLLEWSNEQWLVLFQPSLQIFKINRFELSGRGVELSVDYYLSNHLRFNVYGVNYDYRRNPKQLRQADRFSSLINLRRRLAILQFLQSLEDRRYGAAISYFFDDGQFSAKYDNSVSAIDDTVYTTLSVFAAYDFLTRWSAEFEFGRSRGDGNSSGFLSLGLVFRW